jgi:hypothetical protein
MDCLKIGHLTIDEVMNPKGWILIGFLMDPRTVSRKAMRDAVNKYMSTVFREEPLDPTYLDYSDELTW